MLKKILVVISVLFNVLFIVFIGFSAANRIASVPFLDLDTAAARYTSGVCVVSVPSGNEDIVFTPVEFSLKPGEDAALQYSLYLDGRSMNLALDPIYDHDVVSVTRTGYGILIRALTPGTTVLQTSGEDGFNDLAVITVTYE